MSFRIDTTDFGAMPNQAYGELNGRLFYFRARHGAWSIRTAEPGKDPCIDGEVVVHGEDSKAGWWEETEVLEFLKARLQELDK